MKLRNYFQDWQGHRHVLLTLLLACLYLPSSAIESQYKKRLINGWEFLKGDLGSPLEAFREGKNAVVPIWTEIKLPHSYNADDAVDPDVNYYQGPAWYRTNLNIDNPMEGGRTVLHFEGAGQKTELYVYTRKVGNHEGGYDEFSIDITEAVREYIEEHGGEKGIPVAIRTDNSRDVELIPSDLSDFNLYGGIYRYLNLVYLPPASLEYVHIDANLEENLKKGSISIKGKIYTPMGGDQQIEVKGRIISPEGKEIYTFNRTISSGDPLPELFSTELKSPLLWSPEHPSLYTVRLEVKSGAGIQEITEEFGFRHFYFEKKGPFYLNGERLLLKGTHRHEDHAGTGPAMTEEMIRQEMEMIKSMGVNFIRLGHYQQSRIVLEECDRLGILVWEEIPWCRGGLGGELYKARARSMLMNMISQHYNHPSVIIWGLGNENDWPGDFEEFDEDKIRSFMEELNNISHELDPSRKTAIRRCGFCKNVIDVYSPSIWAGWYRGKYTDYKNVSRTNWEEVDHFLHVEWGASHHARRHSANPDEGLDKISSSESGDERAGDYLMQGGEARVSRDGDWTESYAVNLVDWHLKEQETMDWLTGTAYWPFKDFSTPLRPENPVPYVNQKGVVERDFTPKETFYVFQSYWTEKPMVRIYGHSWPIRWGYEDGRNMVKVYSNCPVVELFLNGKSMGKKARDSQNFPAAGLRWILNFQKGENNIYAVGYPRGTKTGRRLNTVPVKDSISFVYQIEKWKSPAGFILEKVSESRDTVMVSAQLVDEKGIPCLDAKSFVRFDLSGKGKLIDNQGTSTGSRKVQLYNGRALISIKLNKGRSVVSISGESLPPSFLEL